MARDGVSFLLLGPVSAICDGHVVALEGGTVRAVLAELLLRGEAGVGAEELVSSVWGSPGAATRDSVYHYVGVLRSALAPVRDQVRIEARRPGYRLLVADEAVDWRRFQRLVSEARRDQDAGDADRTVALYEEALGLWRGPALADVGDRLAGVRRDMGERRLAALEDWAEVEAGRGNLGRVVELLAEEAGRYPGRERCAALLVEALAGLGRRDEAGAVYRRTRAHMAGELGLDPSPRLEAAHDLALRGADLPAKPPVQLRQPAAGESSELGAHSLPVSGLPRQASHFTNRSAVVEELVANLRPVGQVGRDESSGLGPVCVIHGLAGVGKTTVAVRAAYRLADQYDGGVLFLDLQGQAANAAPVAPAEALDRLLRRLDVPGEQIPAHVEDRAALLWDRLAGRRVLMVLDNARNVAQVRPLLPASPGCGVVITSRARLTGLDEARPVLLEALPVADAMALFRAVAGADRASDIEAGQPDTLTRIVNDCGCLPLAVRIGAARHKAEEFTTLGDLADRLADERSRLVELDDGDRSVAASFTVSYADLPDQARRLFSLLALDHGPDVDAYAAAALAGLPLGEVHRAVAQLLNRHLLGQPARGRYRFHDLVGLFARQYALPEITELERQSALWRLVDYYLAAAEHADKILTPHRYRISLDVRYRPAQLPKFGSYADAFAWLDTELANLVAVCEAAGDHGLDVQCWQLAYTLRGFFFLTKRWEAWETTHEAALAAARRCGDRRGEAMTLNNLGLAAIEQGHHNAAARLYLQAMQLFREVGDGHGEYTALANHAWVLFYQGKFEEFLRDSRRTLAFYEREGSRRNAAITLRGIALAETESGQTADAIAHFQEVLAAFRDMALQLDETMALNGLGEAYERSGDGELARETYRLALEVGRGSGSGYETARAHRRLGDLAVAAGDRARAREHWAQAIETYEQVGAPQAEELRAQLAALDANP